MKDKDMNVFVSYVLDAFLYRIRRFFTDDAILPPEHIAYLIQANIMGFVVI